MGLPNPISGITWRGKAFPSSTSFKDRSNSRHQSWPTRKSKFVLPDSHYAPAIPSKDSPNEPISDYIPFQFPPPESSVCLGNAAVRRTHMPEAAIDKEGQALAGKNEIRLPEHCAIATPALDLTTSEYPY